jgi:hypothetical protein
MLLGQISTTKDPSPIPISPLTSAITFSQTLVLSSPAAYERQSDDAFLAARPCLSSWDSYWKTRISAEIEDQREWMSVLSATDPSIFSSWHKSKDPYCSKTYVVTTTSTITEAAAPECGDGIPRARSITESILTYTTTADKDLPCPQQYKSRAAIDEETLYSPWTDAPKCRIPEAECSESWKYFYKTFADWTHIGPRNLQLSEIDNFNKQRISCGFNGTTCIEPRPDCSGYRDSPMCNFMRHMSQWTDHLFVNCSNVLPYLRLIKVHERFLKGYNKLPPNEIDRKLDDIGCEINVDQFVLLYFDLGIPETRDICTSSGYGEFFPYSYGHTSAAPPSGSAIVSTIVFYPHDMRDSREAFSRSPLNF